MQDRTPVLQVCVPLALGDAVKRAAEREMTSISAYTRRALLDRLKADGVDFRNEVAA
jgi:hypothetical protein